VEKLSTSVRYLSSELQTQVLLSLHTGAKKFSDMKRLIKARETSILHGIKKLTESKLVTRTERGYELTNIGKVHALFLENLARSSRTLESALEFWQNHDLSGIPQHLLLQLGALEGSQIVRSDVTDVLRVHENFIKLLSSSRNIRGLSPIFHPEYPKVVMEALQNGANVELVLTPEVASIVQNNVGLDTLRALMETGRLTLFMKSGLKVAMLVTESVLSLGLFTLTGDYDYSSDLVGTDPESLRWGERLYEEERRRAQRFELAT